ncbi:MAG TPA: SRPBCC family protein [Myxococcota bacterium]
MAEARYTTTTRVPPEQVWDFVQDMDRWAEFVMGYQTHEKRSETESVWTLKGDLGVMSRTLTFEVRITEWNGPSRVRFTLRGLNEPMSGEGAFTIEAVPPGSEGGPEGSAAPAPVPAAPRKAAPLRWLEALARRLLRWIGGRSERAAPPAAGAAASRLTFELRIDPGGPMAPMVNAMIKPLMLPAAEQLADRILARLEEGRAEGGASR